MSEGRTCLGRPLHTGVVVNVSYPTLEYWSLKVHIKHSGLRSVDTSIVLKKTILNTNKRTRATACFRLYTSTFKTKVYLQGIFEALYDP